MKKIYYRIFLTLLCSIISLYALTQAAKPGEVILYEDANFQGRSGSHSFEPKETTYEIPNSNRLKISNDAMSSLKVGKGVMLTLYSDAGFTGAKLVFFEGEYTSLPCDWSDALTSIKMEYKDPNNYAVVKLHSHYGENDWQKSRVQSISVGDWDDEICNDELSAITIPDGLEVIIYADGGFKGREYTFAKKGEYRLSEYDMNDKVSSIRVKRSKYSLKKIEFKNRKELSSNEEVVESQSTDENLTSEKIISKVKIEKSFTNTVSETKTTSNTTGVEIGSKFTAEINKGIIKGAVEASLVLKYEHNWTEGQTKEETETTTFSKELEVPVPPGKTGVVNLFANSVVVEYDVVKTYSPESGTGPDIVEKSKVKMRYSQQFRAVASYKSSSTNNTQPSGTNLTDKVKTTVNCTGKKYLLKENGDIFLETQKIGSGANKLECLQNNLVATVANNKRLKYDGQPNKWSEYATNNTQPSGTNLTDKVKTTVNCAGKKYLLKENGDIFLETQKIGSGANKLECLQNNLVATVANNKRLKYDGQPNKWSDFK